MTMKPRVLIADDERAARFGMRRALESEGCDLAEVEDGVQALAAIRAGAADLVFLDLTMPGLDGLGVLRALAESAPPNACEIVIVTANDQVKSAVECIRLGAADYITKPYEVDRLRAIARRVARRVALENRLEELEKNRGAPGGLGALVGASRPMRELYARIERAARAPVSVLILGETGTGKELIARELHRLSGRTGPFVAVNTAAIAASLAESELFGHVKGAFTGAVTDRRGVFEEAAGGTVFLDEIGDMPPPAQAKILRVLEERVLQPVGSPRAVPVDVRVISATHQDLPAAIEEGHFRRDLYFRIRGVELRAPPLRARRDDIVPLAEHFLQAAREEMRATGPSEGFSPAAVDRLLAYDWPGNVRELGQAVRSAAAMATGEWIEAADFAIGPASPIGEALEWENLLGRPLSEAKAELVEKFERIAIARALAASAGNISAAARNLGMHRQSLQQKMTQLGMRGGPAG